MRIHTTLLFAILAILAAAATPACSSTEDDIESPAPAEDPPAPEPEPSPQPEPDPPAPPTRPYGEECTASAQCLGGLCLDGMCSRYCELDEINTCQDVDAFCVPLQSGQHGCYGYVETGNDPDGAILSIGDVKLQQLGVLGDADLFRLDYWHDGMFGLYAQGDAVTLQIEVFNRIGEPLGIFDGGSVGAAAGAIATIYEPGYQWLVVRNVGNTTGTYSVGVVEN